MSVALHAQSNMSGTVLTAYHITKGSFMVNQQWYIKVSKLYHSYYERRNCRVRCPISWKTGHRSHKHGHKKKAYVMIKW